jgi:hypothetical protein
MSAQTFEELYEAAAQMPPAERRLFASVEAANMYVDIMGGCRNPSNAGDACGACPICETWGRIREVTTRSNVRA